MPAGDYCPNFRADFSADCADFASEASALRQDAADPLAPYRERFLIPARPDGTPVVYLCGNSLGLQPRAVEPAVRQELEDWARLAVDAHFEGRAPWYRYHEPLRGPGARLVGAEPDEVVFMNGLTVNLHLMMVSFYRPTPARHRILIEDTPFPSDLYAVQTQARFHGYDPAEAIVSVKPRDDGVGPRGEGDPPRGVDALRPEDVEALLERDGDRIALVLLPGVNYVTGQLLDIARITVAARRAGCVVGWDLAHAAGNVPLRLHDWDVDFACWCTYKYLNAGPGAVAGCFVHRRHVASQAAQGVVQSSALPPLPRFGGWWGNDPATRFRMHLNREFVPVASADAWQLSNPPILSMAALRASLAIFDEVGMEALRAKSLRLTGYLEFLLLGGAGEADEAGEAGGADAADAGARVHSRKAGARVPSRAPFELITPHDTEQRGCQLSIRVRGDATKLQKQLSSAGVICDSRPPDVIRVAPAPLYNTFHDVWRFARALAQLCGTGPG